jgi:CRISPR system Cascade subunit CasA
VVGVLSVLDRPAGDLAAAGDRVAGIVQKPWGTNYAPWTHPLTPYYVPKPGQVPLPKHPRPGRFAYRQWMGVLLGRAPEANPTSIRAATVARYAQSSQDKRPQILVAGWAMDNMTPLDFTWSERAALPPLGGRAGRCRAPRGGGRPWRQHSG